MLYVASHAGKTLDWNACKYKLLPVDPQMWLVKGHVIRFKDQMLLAMVMWQI